MQSETDQGFIACLPSSEMLCDKQGTGIIFVMKCLLFYHSSDYEKNICIILRISGGLSKDKCSGVLFSFFVVVVLKQLGHIVPLLNAQHSVGRY